MGRAGWAWRRLLACGARLRAEVATNSYLLVQLQASPAPAVDTPCCVARFGVLRRLVSASPSERAASANFGGAAHRDNLPPDVLGTAVAVTPPRKTRATSR